MSFVDDTMKQRVKFKEFLFSGILRYLWYFSTCPPCDHHPGDRYLPEASISPPPGNVRRPQRGASQAQEL